MSEKITKEFLNSLTELSIEVAKELDLSERYNLRLDGLTDLSVEVAKELVVLWKRGYLDFVSNAHCASIMNSIKDQ